MEVLGPTVHDFRPPTIVLPQSRLGLIKGQGLDMDLGLQMRDRGMSSKDSSKQKTPHNLTTKFVKELEKEVLGNNKIVEMF
jgi:hypothetical protein